MNLQQIIDELNLQILTDQNDFTNIYPTCGYTSDLLSCVMAGAGREGIWVTLQAHNNIVAVAALLDLAAIIITENAQPSEETITRAKQEGVVLLSSDQPSFVIVGKLWEIGLREKP